jgi:predicted O-methyltransferase YrrM
MNLIKNIIIKTPLLGRLGLLAYRIKIILPEMFFHFKNFTRWLFTSRETTNFTYDLTPLNKSYLASFISGITGKTIEEIQKYFEEIENDSELRNHIKKVTLSNERSFVADEEADYARRIGWYAFARALKPKVIVETGVEKGLGACILASALIKNSEEGNSGFYYGTDINPEAGYLFTGKYSSAGKILYGDSIESLKKLDKVIDLFINDSDHSADYEQNEYEVIKDKLSPDAVVLGDNSHLTDRLFQFALKTNRRFLFFKEEPSNHWYPGAGIGAAFHRN